jgi:hypothetical protein
VENNLVPEELLEPEKFHEIPPRISTWNRERTVNTFVSYHIQEMVLHPGPISIASQKVNLKFL